MYRKNKEGELQSSRLRIFFLELDETPGILYGMRYDDVLQYANEEHPDFRNYRLPARPPLDPKHEPKVTARSGRAPPRPPKSAIAQPVAKRPTKRGKRQQPPATAHADTDDNDEVSICCVYHFRKA